jgi:hypothetical protein
MRSAVVTDRRLRGAVRRPADYRTWLIRLVPTAVVEVWDGMGHFYTPGRAHSIRGTVGRSVAVAGAMGAD